LPEFAALRHYYWKNVAACTSSQNIAAVESGERFSGEAGGLA